MNKIFLVLVSLLVMIILLVGCGNKNVTTYKDKDGGFKLSFPSNYVAYAIGGENAEIKEVTEHARIIGKGQLETDPVVIISEVFTNDPNLAVINLLEKLYPEVKVIKNEPFNYWPTKLQSWKVVVDIGLEEPEYLVFYLDSGKYVIIEVMERGTTPEDYEYFLEMLVTTLTKY